MSQKKAIQKKDLLQKSTNGMNDKVADFEVIDEKLQVIDNSTKSANNKPQRSIRAECPRIKGLQSKGNFFSKALHYKIYLPSLKVEIFRTYSDFEWLYKKLIMQYGHTSGLFVPALPNKISLKGINKSLISDQCKLMQEFICDVFKHSNLYDDQSTVYFLNPHKNQNFVKMRKSFITQQTPLSADTKEIQNDNDDSDIDSDDEIHNTDKNAKKSKKRTHLHPL